MYVCILNPQLLILDIEGNFSCSKIMNLKNFEF